MHNDFHRSHVRGSPFWKWISSLSPLFFPLLSFFFWYGRYSTWEVWNGTWLFMVAYRFSIDPISFYPCMEVYGLCSRWQMWMVHDNRHGEISFQHWSHCISPPPISHVWVKICCQHCIWWYLASTAWAACAIVLPSCTEYLRNSPKFRSGWRLMIVPCWFCIFAYTLEIW